MTILGILEANEVPAQMIGPHVLPSLDFEVQVPENMAETAKRVIEEARNAGPAAAAEAEAETEA